MKTLLSTIAFFFLLINAGFSQTVNDIPIRDIDVDYVQIVGTAKMFSNKLIIDIDFGQQNKVFNNKDTRIKDQDGKNMEFNSMVDALNFMTKNGYEFVHAFAFSTTDRNVYHHLLRKKRLPLAQ